MQRGKSPKVLDAKGSCLREINHFLVVLVDDLVKSLIFPQVVKVGIFPDLVELLKSRSESSLERVQTCVYLHTIHLKGYDCLLAKPLSRPLVCIQAQHCTTPA